MTAGARDARDGAGLRRLEVALLAAVTAVSFAFLLRPIDDPDFFWHLKTGEWIAEHRRLPATDPFSYTGEAIATPSSRFTLTSYWASQVLFHLAHALGGLSGVVALRVLIAAALLALVWFRREGDTVVHAALLLVFAVAFLEVYSIERPQVLSFVCFAALLAFLDRLRRPADGPAPSPAPLRGFRAPLALALLMAVWANLHGGFVLGQVTIAVVLAAESVKFAHRSLRPVGGAAYRALLVAGGAGLAASLANPNTYHAVQMAFSTAPAAGHGVTITEYASGAEALFRHGEDTVAVTWVAMLLAAAAILTRPRRVDITEAALLAGCGYFAYRHIRHEAVFMIVALPSVGRLLSGGACVRWARAAAIAASLALVLLYARDERGGIGRLRTGGWVDSDDFPVEAADFVLASGLPGNMFNFYDWGGYLLWRLSPARKVFVDGRNIDPEAHWTSSVINMGFEQPGPYHWRGLLDRYGVGYAIVPVAIEGRRVPLVDRLAADPGWVTVFSRRNTVVFARRPTLFRGVPPA